MWGKLNFLCCAIAVAQFQVGLFHENRRLLVLKLLIEVFKKCKSQVLSHSHTYLRNEPDLEEMLHKIAFHGQVFLVDWEALWWVFWEITMVLITADGWYHAPFIAVCVYLFLCIIRRRVIPLVCYQGPLGKLIFGCVCVCVCMRVPRNVC